MPNPLRSDPSRTTMLRKRYMADMQRRFKAVSRAIQRLVVDDDVFGLIKSPPLTFMQAKQAWRFRSDANKVKEYRKWLQQQIDAKILTVDTFGKPWTATYAESAYRKGMTRAYTQIHSTELAKSVDFYEGSKAQFIKDAFSQPAVLSKIELMYTRAFDELRGVTAVMGQQMSRTLAAGMIRGDGPRAIARELRKISSVITKTRALAIARTEIIMVHAEGQLDAFERLGVEEVGIMAEWSTAGDDRVCILEGQAKILTKQGLVKIKDIQEGNLVLTHKDRYKKVTKVWHRKTNEKVVQIILKGCLNANKRAITVTSNHPLLVNRGGKILWTKAGILRVTDSVCYFARRCPVCNEKMPMGNKFCSPGCAVRFGNKKRWEDPEQHKALSKRNKEEGRWDKMVAGFQRKFKSKVFRRKFSELVSEGQLKSYRDNPTHYNNVSKSNKEKGKRKDWGWKNKKRGDSARKKGRKVLSERHFGGTWIEKKVEWWLKEIKVNYESQKYFYLNKKRRWVDFYLPDYNLIVEVDGEYWHQDKKKDRLKDKHAKQCGFDTLRLVGDDIRNNFEIVAKKINNAIHNGCFVFLEIKKLKKRKLKKNQPVYNLSVKDDNSYVANYIVVHNCEQCGGLEGQVMMIAEARGRIPLHPNCRCAWIPFVKGIHRRRRRAVSKGLPIPGAISTVKKIVKPTPKKAIKKAVSSVSEVTPPIRYIGNPLVIFKHLLILQSQNIHRK